MADKVEFVSLFPSVNEEIVSEHENIYASNVISSEEMQIPENIYIYIDKTTGKQLSVVQSSMRMDEPHQGGSKSASHVASHVMSPARVISKQWQPPSAESVEVIADCSRVGTNALESEVATTKLMVQQQQVVLSSLVESINTLKSEFSRKTSDSTKVKVESNDDYESVSESEMSDYDSDVQIIDDSGDSKSNDKSRLSKVGRLENLFHVKEDFGLSIHDSLASTVNRGISNNFNLKDVMDRNEHLKTPSNCSFLTVPKLNEELLFEESIDGSFKQNDGVLQKTQGLLTKGMIPLVQMMDNMVKDDVRDADQLFDLATQSLQLLAYTHHDLTNVRRKFMKPAVAKKYKRLCTSNAPLTSQLLGDDLDKQLKDINDRKRIGVQMTGDRKRPRENGPNVRPVVSVPVRPVFDPFFGECENLLCP